MKMSLQTRFDLTFKGTFGYYFRPAGFQTECSLIPVNSLV